MTYTNHILFRSLDEARRHQQGEEVGKPATDWALRQLEPDRPKTPYKRKEGVRANKTSEERKHIASIDEPAKEVAERYGVTAASVRDWRRKYGFKFDHKPKPRADEVDYEFRKMIAFEEGKPKAIAAKHGITPQQVTQYRIQRKQGKFDD